jgi:hypothetical protein
METNRERQQPPGDDTAYLEYELSDGRRVLLAFANLNDRDGCHISLDMHQAYIGPVDEAALRTVLAKFQGRILAFL